MQQPRQEAVANTDTAQTEMESQIERRASSLICARWSICYIIGYRDEDPSIAAMTLWFTRGLDLSRGVSPHFAAGSLSR